MYDAIVVGARCAGSPVAMLLARKGYTVLLVDRDAFPSDQIMSTHYIHQRGTAKLREWGILDNVAASNCPPMQAFTFDIGPFALTGTPPALDGVSPAYCPRRYVIDDILVKAAVAAGAELRENFTVESLTTDDSGRVTGLRGHARGGARVTERARIVIGADGIHSLVAKQVQAPVYNEVPPLTCGYYSYFSGLPLRDGPTGFARDYRFIVTFPTNDDLTCVAVQWPKADFHQFRADIEGNFFATLDTYAPAFAEQVRAGRREARFVGYGELANFVRTPYGPGWALVGDAGYHQDPNTGQGITNAFRDAELLANAIDAGFSGTQPLDDALARYEAQRNEAGMPYYDLTMKLASLEPPPEEMQQLFGALRGNQPDTDRFLGLIAQVTPVQEFFAEENVGRIIGMAQEREAVLAD
jgi:2-polyprenyl-6-methoxyphenol hydroxylase-like FAD-dependent oxidoreductase